MMKKGFVVAALVLGLSACSTMTPPRYATYPDNTVALRQFEDAKAFVSRLHMSHGFDAGCRMMGQIAPADGLTVPAFIAKAINDEFKIAGIHSEDGVRVSGEVTYIDFSSMSNLTQGYWSIGLRLESSTGEQLAVDSRYDFQSGFDAITACNATADALTPAVQDLIRKTISHPRFGALIGI